MDSTRGRTSHLAPAGSALDERVGTAPRAGAGGAADGGPGDVGRRVGRRVGQELGAPLGKELRESALLLGLALVVLGLVTLVAGGALLLD